MTDDSASETNAANAEADLRRDMGLPQGWRCHVCGRLNDVGKDCSCGVAYNADM